MRPQATETSGAHDQWLLRLHSLGVQKPGLLHLDCCSSLHICGWMSEIGSVRRYAFSFPTTDFYVVRVKRSAENAELPGTLQYPFAPEGPSVDLAAGMVDGAQATVVKEVEPDSMMNLLRADDPGEVEAVEALVQLLHTRFLLDFGCPGLEGPHQARSTGRLGRSDSASSHLIPAQ